MSFILLTPFVGGDQPALDLAGKTACSSPFPSLTKKRKAPRISTRSTLSVFISELIVPEDISDSTAGSPEFQHHFLFNTPQIQVRQMAHMLQHPALEPLWTTRIDASDNSNKRQGIVLAGSTEDHLVTPTDSNPERSASIDTSSISPISTSTSTFAAAITPTTATPPRRKTFKITSYCPQSFGVAPVEDTLRRTRSQSPPPAISSKVTMKLQRSTSNTVTPAAAAAQLLSPRMPESNMSQDWPASGAVLNLSTKRVVGVRAAKGQGEISEPVSPDITHGIVKEAASLDPPELAEPGQSRCVAADCEDAREAGSATNTPPGSNSDKPLPPRSQPATMGADQTAYYEALMLRAQEQRDAAMAEANSFQQQLYDLKRSSQREIQDLRAQVDGSAHKLKIEYELRTAAETKCSLMECELAELSSHIQFEAQNLVAQERREHRDELERLAKKQEEMVQLMEMERAQVESLKQSLESVNLALDRERGETERLRSEMMAFERKVSSFVSVPDLPVLRDSAFAESPLLPDTARVLGTASVVHGSGGSTPPSAANSSDSVVIRPVATVSPVSDPHIAGVLFFGTDATRTDTRLTEFLGFVNASSDKESMQSSFMQRSMREDVEPTLVADSSSSMPSLSGWNKHRRLLHGVQENTLILESFSPRVKLSRVLSLGCYLCGCSVNRPSGSSPAGSLSDRVASSSSGGSEKEKRQHMFRMRFSDNDEDNKPICHHCHARMVAVCSFFSYLNMVRKGLIKRPVADIWLEVNKARLQMWLARSGASPESRLSCQY